LGHAIGDNRGMKRLSLVMLVVLAGGCAPQDEPLPTAPPFSPHDAKKLVVKPQAENAKLQAENAKLRAENVKLQAENAKQQAKTVDEFNLPLVIQIETPEVPPEIQKVSPPIEQKPEPH
jgi:hypothetical protein